jgi:hypothetical protein
VTFVANTGFFDLHDVRSEIAEIIVAKGPGTARQKSRTLMPASGSELDDCIRQILHRRDGNIGLVRGVLERPVATIIPILKLIDRCRPNRGARLT